MREDELPGEDEQYRLYSQVCGIMQETGKLFDFLILAVINRFRSADEKGSKPLSGVERRPVSSWKSGDAQNASQSARAFKHRLQKVKILAPMIIDVSQWIENKKKCDGSD
jgi:hypothetical protein